MLCSLKLYEHAYLFSNPFLIFKRLVGLSSLSQRGPWELADLYCPQFCGNQTHCCSHRLHSWDPAGPSRFINLCDFKTLDRFKRSWLATAPAIWNRLPAKIILQRVTYGWHTILQKAQHCE